MIPRLAPTLPRKPIELGEAIELFPTLRQSLLGTFDKCNLLALFNLRHTQGWNTHPQARGTMFHRFAGECLRTMREQDSQDIPVAEALEILYEVLRQRDVPIAERVRVPLRELKSLRMAAIKFAADNEFTVSRILDIEKRLEHDVRYQDIDGTWITRTLSGQLDVLMVAAPDEETGEVTGAVVIDWKDTWALPPQRMEEPDEHEDGGENVSYEGYFQQRFYGWLVMREFPAVQHVTLREFYPRKTKVREATVTRARDLEHIEREMALLAEAFDATVAAGTRDAGTLRENDAWRPSPGAHCAWCPKPGKCPIEREARGEGAIQNENQARDYAAQFEQADAVRTHRRKALQVYNRLHGFVTLRGSKGRRGIGFRERIERHRTKDGSIVPRTKTVWGTYNLDDSDRGAHPSDEKLREAMLESIEEVKQARRAARKPARRKRAKTPA